MSEAINRQILLKSRPVGEIKDSDFEHVSTPIPTIGDGEFLARNLYLSLDPAMRGWMNDSDSYIEPVQLGDPMRASSVSVVVESNNPDYKPGDKVVGMGNWQDYVVYGPKDMHRLIPEGLPLPLTNFLSILGITGLTAYFGFLDIGEPKEGDTVVVSAAAGAVGSVVGQIAKNMGCHVVGLAGSDEKCAWVKDELGFDACINYKTQNVAKELFKNCPNKIDVYFDNVGGSILNDVLGQINVHARISICGAISQYNATEMPPGPSNYLTLLTKRSKMQGFIVTDFAARFPEAVQQLAQWSIEGKIKHKEEVVDGLENAPVAIHKLFKGTNQGKLIIKVADEA